MKKFNSKPLILMLTKIQRLTVIIIKYSYLTNKDYGSCKGIVSCI